MFNKVIKSALVVVMIAGVIGFAGCSGVSDEQIAELEALRAEVKALNKEVGSLKDEKAALEKEIADKNAKLDQCAKLKAETKANLEKIAK
jgi:septal ring factor EnvC (AmiA/AmiB activator)